MSDSAFNLRALLAGSGLLVTIAGIAYMIASPLPGVTRADLRAAGIDDFCDPVQVSCQVRQVTTPFCFPGQPKYGTISIFAYECDRDGGPPVLIIRWPKRVGVDCFEPVGPSDTACVVTAASFDDGGDPTVVVATPSRCACRATGQNCRYQLPDGGTPLMDFGRTYPAPFAGGGCVRKACQEVMGDLGQSMPDECL